MNVRLICVGKLRASYIAQACAALRTRLRPYLTLEQIEIKAADGSAPAHAVDTEAAAILRAIDPADVVWLLDPAGTQWSSEELSAELERLKVAGTARLTLVVAGTFGAGAALKQRATRAWSLSRLTFLHEWARAIVLEQLYRASKIARNEPYHH